MAEKYLGYVTERIPSNDEAKGANAILKVVAIKENNEYRKLSPNEVKKYCSPNGYVFGPSFFNSQNCDFCNKAFIEFEISDSKIKEKKILNQTDYIVNYIPHPKGINLPRLIDYKDTIDSIVKNGYLSPELLNATIDKKNIFGEEDIKFLLYNSTEQKGIGIFKYNKHLDAIEASIGKEVFEIIIPDYGVIVDNDSRKYLLFNEEQILVNQGSIIDFMTNEQIAEWLKIKMKDFASIDKKTISIISKLPEFQSTEDDRDASRFERLRRKAEAFEIDVKILIELICKHPGYFSQFMRNISVIEQEVKERFQKEYLDEAPQVIKSNQQKIEEQKIEISNLDSKLEYEKKKIASEIEKEKVRLLEDNEKLSKQIEKKNIQLKTLNENYDSVVATISAITPILSAQNEIDTTEKIYGLSRVTFPKAENARPFSKIREEDEESFISFMKRHVCFKNEKLEEYLKQVKKVFSHKACFIPNTALSYLFAKALRNTEVIILHIEHDWLHYSDFAKHGLLEAFMEANNNEGKNYILVLDGLNVTQPECGLRPLLNLINGNEPFLEGCGFAFPKNMTVMATVVPTSKGHTIGLKLSVEYFGKWFAVGNPTEESDKIFLPENFWDDKVEGRYGYVEPSDLPKEIITEKAEILDNYLYF